ncbi:MAG: type II toxin-antitoxin system RelE/ParE family toxin, partial [Nitrospinae bacterium]|nr:type II toxin-antitoxin system RelE/ParE family toxin [Nitrospinota bacterium]
LVERVAVSSDPRHHGEPLKGSRFDRLWRYRVGDYRVICQIRDAALVILVVRIGHRKQVYR